MNGLLVGGLIGALIIASLSTWRAPRLTSLIWWALAATLCVTAGIAMNLPGDIRENLTALVLIIPLVWVGLQFWAYWEKSKWRVATGMIGLCLISGLVILTSTPLG